MSTYRQTDKAKAMMAARLIADIDGAPIITNAMMRGAKESTHTLMQWVAIWVDMEEVHHAAALAIKHLDSIERKARSIVSTPITNEILVGLHCAKLKFKATVRCRLTERGTLEEDFDDLEDEFGAESSNGSRRRIPGQMPMDIQLSMEKATVHFYILFLVLLCIMLLFSLLIVVPQHKNFLTKAQDVEESVTMTLLRVSEEALNLLYAAMVKANAEIKQIGIATASSVLTDMTARLNSSQDMATISDNYLTEYRAAVQDFTNSNQVTSVTTARAFGGICMTNETFPIRRINDIYTKQPFVVPILTENQCANDATATGIFSIVVPSYLNYDNFIVTYRRNLARLASFYHAGFGLSVSVTHDRVTLQEYLVPPVTLVGKIDNNPSDEKKAVSQLVMWFSIVMIFFVCFTFLVLTLMMRSQKKRWNLLYSTLIGLVVGTETTATLLVSQAVYSSAENQVILKTTFSLLMGATGAMLSSSMLEYGTTNDLFTFLYQDLLAGELFVSNVGATVVIPNSMEKVAQDINAARLSSYQRGAYMDFEYGYAVSSSYIEDKEVNFIVAKKLPPKFHLSDSTAFIFVAAMVAGATVAGYMTWSPLSRLRSFGDGSPILRYRVHPAKVRYILYGLMILLSLIGIICVNIYAVNQVRLQLTQFSQDVFGLLGGVLKAKSIANVCTDRCGMPDFSVLLYFKRVAQAGSDYPEIHFINQDLPMPYPKQDNWEDHYLGAQLISNNIFTTLLNVPSFSTPIVNRTVNETEPRYLLRNLLGSARIDNNSGFAMERFPHSFYPKAYSFSSHTIGLTIMICMCALSIAVCEVQYIRLYQAYKSNKMKMPRKPYILMGLALALVPLGFLIHGGSMQFLIRNEMHEFAYQELAFLGSAVAYRLGLLSLNMLESTHEEVVEALVAAALESATSAMLMGNVFFRVRVAEEYPERGSQQVRIYGVLEQEPVNLGPLDQGFIPVCGRVNGTFVSTTTTEIVNYCIVEIPQSASISSPRLFLLSTTGHRLWVGLPTMRIWGFTFGISASIGLIVACVLGLSLFLTLNTAHVYGYPFLDTGEMLPFSEPIPPRFTKEFFIPCRQRQMWVASILVLGVLLVYYSASLGDFMHQIRRCREVAVAFESQTNVLRALSSSTLCDAYYFIIFPFPKVTINNLLQLGANVANGNLQYVFVTEPGLDTFQRAVSDAYNNISKTNNELNNVLGAANDGYGSYCSLLASQYENTYIVNQESALQAIDTILTNLQVIVNSPGVINFVSCMNLLHEISILRDLIKKLFVLDHIAVSSYADFAYSVAEYWPFTDDKAALVSAVREDAAALETLVANAFTAVSNAMALAAPSAKNTLTEFLNRVNELYVASYAIRSFTAPLWGTQQKRCAESVSLGNTTQATVASAQQAQELEAIAKLSTNLTTVLDYEMSARKTFQMVEHIRSGEPVTNAFNMKAWQRWNELKKVRRMCNVAFSCTVCAFVIVGGCVVLSFKLLRYKTELVQGDIDRNEVLRIPPPKKVESPVPSHPSASSEERRNSGKKLEVAEDSLTPSSLGKQEYSGSPVLEPHASTVADSPVVKGVPPRRHRVVSLWIGALLVITIIPFLCSFWLVLLAHDYVHSELKNIAVVLSLTAKAEKIFQTIESISENSVYCYLGMTTTNDLLEYLSSLQSVTLELGAAYNWELGYEDASVVSNLYSAFVLMYDALDHELNVYLSTVGTTSMKKYFEPQSAFGRTFLPTLTNANRYGALIPMSVTTDGSEMYTFAEAYHTKKVEEATATAATDTAAFRLLYNEYTEVIKAMSTVSDAELTLWHATVGAAREDGAAVAVTYGNFNNLVGTTALSAISTATDPSGAAAVDAVSAYYKTLLEDFGTTAQQTNLFTNTMTAPTDAASSSLGAYKAAGYVSSYLTATVTEGKFANIFGYNRNLTSASSSLAGKQTLVQRISNYNTALKQVFSSPGNRSLESIPASTNQWIWYSQVRMNTSGNNDLRDLVYLWSAVRWCCITSFWGLLLGLLVAYSAASL